jgi:hypothetical protein
MYIIAHFFKKFREKAKDIKVDKKSVVFNSYAVLLIRGEGFFFMLSIRWRSAITGCLQVMRGPEYLMIVLTVALIEGS